MIFKYICLIFIGLASGVLIAGGVFGLITALGIIPRMAARTKTFSKIYLYEDAVMLGGILASTAFYVNYRINAGAILPAAIGLFAGMFVGLMALSLTEVLNLLPIFKSRLKLPEKVSGLVIALAFGRLLGSLLYFLIPGFYSDL